MAPIEPEEIEKILDEHGKEIEKIEGKVDKMGGEINQLKIDFAVTNQRLDNIEKSQANIELGQIKNREISLQNFNSMNQIINKNTDSILETNKNFLETNKNFLEMSNNFLKYMTEKDKCDNKTEEKLNEGWNKREIKIAVIGAISTIICAGFALWQVVCK